MSEYTVDVVWTGFIHPKDPRMNDCEVVYMYCNTKKVLYIGEAVKQSVKQRHDGHKKDGVVDWILKNCGQYGIKIGYLRFPKGMKYSDPMLHDIQTLFIYKERQRGMCGANIHNTKDRNKYRPGMTIKNWSHYVR